MGSAIRRTPPLAQSLDRAGSASSNARSLALWSGAFQARWSSFPPRIAVGTALSGGPPHRSQRAALPHWAPASGPSVEAHVWEGMLHTGRREPPSCDAIHPFPVEPVSLAAAS